MGILSTQLEKDRTGRVTSTPSTYDPSQEVKDITVRVMNEFNTSAEIMNRSFRQFNDMSLIHRQSKDQKSFNAWQEPMPLDLDEQWKSRAVRPIIRNKIISIAAHITANLIFPKVFAQNDNDEEDVTAAEVMRDLMEWWGDESNYEKNFLYTVIAALVNPATIINTEYCQAMRQIKEIKADGTWETKQVMDELFSGFQNNIIPVDELYIENIYEHDIQKQGRLIWRKVISYSLAQAKYNTNQKFKDFVRPGVQVMAGDDNDTFYEQRDTNMDSDSVEEIIYWNRNDDLRLVFINGVLVTEHDQPNPREDKSYPFAKTGYELIDEGKFFYFRSLANKGSVDEEVVNTLYRMVIDGTYLQLMPPTAVFGDEEINSSIIAPGTVTGFDKDTKMERIDVGNNISDGRATLEKVEDSISESSIDSLGSGQQSKGTPATAFEISRVEQNSRTMLGLFGKMIGFLVVDWGKLAIGDIKQFATIADIEELSSEAGLLKFRTILIPEKIGGDGKTRTKRIQFTADLPNGDSEQETLSQSFRILQEEGMDSKFEIAKINPKAFRNLKYKLRVTPDIVTPMSDNVKKAMNLEAYDRAIDNPLSNQESIFKDLLLKSYETTKDNPDKYISNKTASPVQAQLQEQAAPVK
ncbi:MAG: hypothetical protein ACTSQH_00405 [Candidatus Hodarchaeales archaeon]